MKGLTIVTAFLLTSQSLLSLAEQRIFVTNNDIPELQYLNRSVDPCEDFYEYTCGNFKNVHPRPNNYPLWDHYAILQDQLHRGIQEILEKNIEDTDPTSLKKAKIAYNACLDVEYSDKLPVPELEVLKDLDGWPLIEDDGQQSKFSWNIAGDSIATYGVPLFFQITIFPSPLNSSENVVYIDGDSVLNPSIHDILEENSSDFLKHPGPLTKNNPNHPYITFLTTIAVFLKNLTGGHREEKDIQNDAIKILEFMRLVQEGGITDNGYVNTIGAYTIKTLQEETDKAFGNTTMINWLDYLNRVFGKSGVKLLSNHKVMVGSLKVFFGILKLIEQTDDAMLKNFVGARIITYTSPDSNNLMRKAYEDFKRAMGDMEYSRSEYCVRKIADYPRGIGFSMILTYEYHTSYFNKTKLNIAEEMILDLNEAFTDILKTSGWLDDVTRERALKKIQNMITLLGYPCFVENHKRIDEYYENLRICKWDHFGNSQRLRAFKLASNFALFKHPRNREVWGESPLIANAFYNPLNNRILFPISMINPVFYRGNINAVDYGRIGAVIGHEITHGFDNTGRFYDENGAMNPWFTPEAKKEFDDRENCFVEQYSKYYVPKVDKYINGTITSRENIADNGGLRDAYQALRKFRRRKFLREATEEFTTDQLFFIGFGTMWCVDVTDDQLLKQINSSGHAPAKYRVIGSVSNNKEFSKAFNCPLGSRMNPENKCLLW